MERIDEEKEIVKKMKNSGMTLAGIAQELDRSIYWVVSRCDEMYSPVKARESKEILSEKEKIQIKLDDIKKERARIKQKRAKFREKINRPLNRSYEEECEYRKERDKDPGAPPAVPVFDNHKIEEDK